MVIAPKFKTKNTKFIGGEPVWDTVRAEKFTDTEFQERLVKSLNYYNYNFVLKDLRKQLVIWVNEQAKIKDGLFTAETAKLYAKTPDSLTTMTACSLVKAFGQGMPVTSRHTQYITKIVNDAVDKHAPTPEEEQTKKGKVKLLTIQDRLNMIMNDHVLHFDILEDEVISGKKVNTNTYEYLADKSVPQGLLGKMITIFEHRAAEIAEAKAGECEQLKEAYAHLKAKDYKRFSEFYKQIIEGLEQYKQIKKATNKARVKKSPGKAKIVAKLKYLKEASAQKLVSVNPITIIGAKKLFVFNVKTRKLGVYVANDSGLGVKGTTITDFDTKLSVQKTLRKPELQLKAFGKAGKVALRKFLADIKAVEIKLNGRINTDTVLLKVE